MDAFITSTACLHDLKRKGNSRTGSIYIVKPKMHGPEETEFTNLIFTKVEEVLNLNPNARISILGLAYKENTHSIKNSPSLALLEHLDGFEVCVHDPVVTSDAAGIPVSSSANAEDISKKGWDAVIATNLTGGFLMSREVFKASMAEHGGGFAGLTTGQRFADRG